MNNPLYEKILKETSACVQCGYCLPACPTYASTGRESASPRGRIHLARMAAEQKIDPLRDLAQPIDLCLGCRACEPVCPMDVKYGEILEAAREEIRRLRDAEPDRKHRITRLALRHLFPYPKRLRLLAGIGRTIEHAGLRAALRKTGLIRAFSEKLDWFERALPEIPPSGERPPAGVVFPARGERRMRAALFTGCIMDAVMHRIHGASVKLLTAAGAEVVIPAGQNCCGALHAHQGMTEEAKDLARRNIEAFERSGADFAVTNAGGCGAQMGEYGRLLKGDPEWADRAQRFAGRVRDISEILLECGPLPFSDGPEITVTYQDSCHLLNVQHVRREPRELLQQMPGVRLVEMKGADRCCGSGGIYNLLHFEESMKILDEKMAHVRETGARYVVSGNPGCILQMQIGIERQGLSRQLKSVHLIELLAERCGL